MTKKKSKKKRKVLFFFEGRKKKIKYEKKRETYLTFDFGEKTAVDRFEVDGKTSEARIYKNGKILVPKEIMIETSYKRNKGPKILHRIPVAQNHCYIDPNLVLKKYNLIFAIDTNSKNVNNELVSLSSIFRCKIIPGDEKSLCLLWNLKFLEFRNINNGPEKEALKKLIEMVMLNPKYTKKIKIGIIVDCDLDNLKEINTRNIPIVKDYYLPDNFELIYASSDIGKEYVPNKVISACDREAKKLLSHIISNLNDTKNLTKVDHPSYTHFRVWESINPKDYLNWYKRGNILSKSGKYKDAIKAYDRAIELNPKFHQAWSNKGSALAMLGKSKKAIEAYDRAIEIKPDAHGVWYNKAITFVDLGRFEEATEIYEKTIEINPKNVGAHQNLTELCITLNNFSKALKTINKAHRFTKLPKDHAINCYLECIIRKMLDFDVSSCEKKLKDILKEKFILNWNLKKIEDWIKKSELDNEKKKYMSKLNTLFKKVIR